MSFSISHPALLRGVLAGALLLTACSRSDRTESGGDNSAVVLPDTSSHAAQPSGAGTVTGAVSDTATPSAQPGTSAQPNTSAKPNSPRAETAPPNEKDAAAHRSQAQHDTANVSSQPSDSARVTADTAETSSVVPDTSTSENPAAAETAAAGYAAMARDTSTVADQADTAATPLGDLALQVSIDTSAQAKADVSAGVAEADGADTTNNDGRIRPPEDSTEILGQVTEDSTPGAGTPDTTEMVRVRPPEDSTEILGNVTPDEAAYETADEQVVRPEDRGMVAASQARRDELGAAPIGGNVTGAEAVALMSREGVRCAVVDPEANEAVRWDMSSTPVTLNPCGMGSMNPSRIWTER
jgi:hypothetical protein